MKQSVTTSNSYFFVAYSWQASNLTGPLPLHVPAVWELFSLRFSSLHRKHRNLSTLGVNVETLYITSLRVTSYIRLFYGPMYFKYK